MSARLPTGTKCRPLRHLCVALHLTAIFHLSSFAAPSPSPPAQPPVTALAFTEDGSHLLSNGDRAILIRSPLDGRAERSITCPLAKITCLATSGTQPTIVVAGGGEPAVRGALRIANLDRDSALTEIPVGTDLVTSIALGATGRRLAVACADHSAWILPWNAGVPATNPAIRLTGHAGAVLAVAFLDADETVLTAGTDRSLKVWKAATGELVRSLQHHTEAIHSIAVRPSAFPPDGQPSLCATGGEDRTVRVWQPAIGRMVRIVRGHDSPVLAVAWARDGHSFFTAGKEGIVRRIDAGSDVILDRWHWHPDWIYALAVSPDGSKIATGDWIGAVRIHRLAATP